MLCVIDDAQWLDRATTDAVLVAARRLGADRVAVVFAARDGEGATFAPDGIPSVALAPLSRRCGPRRCSPKRPAPACPTRSQTG